MHIQNRTKNVKYAIRDVLAPARALEAKGHKILKLNIGDPNKYDFDTPEFIKDAAVAAIHSGKNFYGDSEGIASVTQAIAEREKQYKNVNIAPENILPTTGATEGINFLFASLLGEGDEVLIPGPTYPLYTSMAEFYGAKPIEYHTIEKEGWIPNIQDMRAKINPKTRAIVVINPNNPTGAVYPESILQGIIDIATEFNIPIISDEIYDLLTFNNKFVSIASLSTEANVITLGGLSKVYFAPGWRAGWMLFSGPDIDPLKEAIHKLARARISIHTPSHYAIETAMREPHGFLKKYLKNL